MSAKALLYDISKIDFDNVVADIEAIRRVNPQRYEMEHLTAVVYESVDENVCVGYKDVATDEFGRRQRGGRLRPPARQHGIGLKQPAFAG